MKAIIPLAALLAVAQLILMSPVPAALPSAQVVPTGLTGEPDEPAEPVEEASGEAGEGDDEGEEAEEEEEPVPADPHRRRSTLYVTSRGSSEVLVFSRDTGEKIATVEVGRSPTGIAARRDGDRIYVVSSGSHTLEVIDGARREVLDRVQLRGGSTPMDVVLGPRETVEHTALGRLEQVVYLAASGSDQVIALDAGSLQQINETPVCREPTRLAVSPDGLTLYALCPRAGRVDLLDLQDPNMPVFSSIPVGAEPMDLAADPATGNLFVIRPGAPVLMVLTPGASQAREVSIDGPAESLAVDSQARRVLLAAPAMAQISVVSPATGASTKVIDAVEVSRLVVDPEGTRIYALSHRRDLLLFVDQMLGSVQMEIPAGRKPWDLVLIP